MTKADNTRICILLSKKLNSKLSELASEQEISKNTLIRIVLNNYVEKSK